MNAIAAVGLLISLLPSLAGAAVTVPDNYEFDGGVDWATPLFVERTQEQHSIFPVGDADWYRYDLAADTLVTLYTTGAGDTEMWLIAEDGGTLRVDSDSGVGSNAAIICAANEPGGRRGTYYLRVNSTVVVDDYTMVMEGVIQSPDPYEPNDTKATATELPARATQLHALRRIGTNPSELDWFRFDLDYTADIVLSINGPSPVSDLEMTLLDALDNVIDIDDDDGPGLFPIIQQNNLSPGRYYLGVEEHGNNAEVLAYSLTFTRLQRPVIFSGIDEDAWVATNASSPGVLGPTYPGESGVTEVFQSNKPVLGTTASNGDHYHWWNSPRNLLPFVENGLYHLDWTLTARDSNPVNDPFVRLRWAYGPVGNLGGGSLLIAPSVEPITVAGSHYEQIIDHLDVREADKVLTDGGSENGIQLFFEAFEFDPNGETDEEIRLQNLEITVLDRAVALANGVTEVDVPFFDTTNLAEVGFNYSSGPGISITRNHDDAVFVAPFVSPAGSLSIYGNPPIELLDQGIGMIPFTPSVTLNRFYQFTARVDASANGESHPLPRLNMQLATFDTDPLSQRMTSSLDVTAKCTSVSLGGRGLTNPAYNTANQVFELYLVPPRDRSLSASSSLGDSITANVRLQDFDSNSGGPLRLENMTVRSFPITNLP